MQEASPADTSHRVGSGQKEKDKIETSDEQEDEPSHRGGVKGSHFTEG